MERAKTLQQIIDDGAEVFPDYLDIATQNSILAWFQFRRVSDNQKFPVYFRRILSRDYSRYRELLRIEAGKTGDTGFKTEFDWLVTNYEERYDWRQSDSHSTGSTETDGERTAENSTTVTTEGKDTTSATGGVQSTRESETESTAENHGSTTTRDSRNTANNTEVRAGALSRATPMSASYDNDDLNTNDHRRGYITETEDGLNVGQKDYSQDTVGDDFIVGLHRNFPELKIKNPTTASDAHTATGAIGKEKGTGSTTSNDDTESTTQTLESTTTRNEANNETERTATTDTTGETTETNKASGLTKEDRQGIDLTESIHSGRGGEVAEILKRASEYIQSSSAFDWLRGQLEPCFMACID